MRSRDEGSRTGPTRTARGDRARGGGWGRDWETGRDRDGRIRACYVLGRRHVRTWLPDLIELAVGCWTSDRACVTVGDCMHVHPPELAPPVCAGAGRGAGE